jgi:hypothetical protein
VRRILRRERIRPYKYVEHQELVANDYARRLEFAVWAADKLRDRDFFSRVLFCDEATFSNVVSMNKQNSRYWAIENPRWMCQVPHQHQWRLNVWCGILGNHVIGPYFFDAILTGPIYSEFLRNVLPTLLEDVPLEIRQNMWFQHDGAPPHGTIACTNYLNLKFANKWIGLRGPVAWPARSPDLTPLDYFLWGRVKDLVYARAPTTQEDMRRRIVDACASITAEELRNVRNSLANRIHWCIDVEGAHFEHLM